MVVKSSFSSHYPHSRYVNLTIKQTNCFQPLICIRMNDRSARSDFFFLSRYDTEAADDWLPRPLKRAAVRKRRKRVNTTQQTLEVVSVTTDNFAGQCEIKKNNKKTSKQKKSLRRGLKCFSLRRQQSFTASPSFKHSARKSLNMLRAKGLNSVFLWQKHKTGQKNWEEQRQTQLPSLPPVTCCNAATYRKCQRRWITLITAYRTDTEQTERPRAVQD